MLQYYLAYGEMVFSMASLRSMPYLKNSNQAMLEGFSTNEGVKIKNNKKLRKNKTDNEGAFGRKRRNIWPLVSPAANFWFLNYVLVWNPNLHMN